MKPGRKPISPPSITKEQKILQVIREIQQMKQMISQAAITMKSNMDVVLSMGLNQDQPRS